MNINFYHEIGQLKPEIDSIFNDMTSEDPLYRKQGESNLYGMLDKIRILAELKLNVPIEIIIADSPQGECLLERLRWYC